MCKILVSNPNLAITRYSFGAQGIECRASVMLAEHPGPERQKQRWLFGRCTRRLWGGEDGGVEALRVGKISICRGPGNNGGG